MIFLNAEIIINVTDSDNYKLSPDKWYKVIGSQQREKMKDGKLERQDMFMVVNNDGHIVCLFPSKCNVRILSEKKS